MKYPLNAQCWNGDHQKCSGTCKGGDGCQCHCHEARAKKERMRMIELVLGDETPNPY